MKKIPLQKLSRVFLYLSVLVTLIFLLVFYLKYYLADLPEDVDFETEMEAYGNHIDLLIGWAFGLLAVALMASLAFAIVRLVGDPKRGIKAFVAIGIFALILIVSYAFADGTLLEMPGYSGTDNVPAILKYADTLIYSTYVMLILAFLSIIYSEIDKFLKKLP
jgi:hypothetical protein